MDALIAKARFHFHEQLFETNTLTLTSAGVASNADTSSRGSKAISRKIVDILVDEHHHTVNQVDKISGQTLGKPLLHASVSAKYTMRSDRAQNSRTEALNLIRNRKGHLPHIVVVTAEPMPNRLASLALGTGDIDCVYHFALYELMRAVKEVGSEDAVETLETLVQGKRLKDISDLPLDLSV